MPRSLHPAHMHIVKRGTIILVRREHASYTSSSLLMVTAADATDEQCLDSIQVQVIPTSAVTTELRRHLLQFEDADDVLRSHHVLQSLVATAQRNGPAALLSQFVGIRDWVFPDPSGGALRKYLLGDKCPNPSCQHGYCIGRERIYQAHPFLQAGLRPDVLHWYLSEIHDSPMLCFACYGLKTVRSNERIAIASLMINTGRQQPTIAVAQRIDDHRSYLAHVLRPSLGHDAVEHSRSDVPHFAGTGSSRSFNEVTPGSGTDDSASLIVGMSPRGRILGTRSEISATLGLARDSSGQLKHLNPSLRGGDGNPAHPGRRSTQQQLESIGGSGQGRSIPTPVPPARQAANFTPAQLAGRAARARYDRLRAQQVAESQVEHSASTVNPMPSSSRVAPRSASRPGLSRIRASVHRPPRAEVGRSRSYAQPAPFVSHGATSSRPSVAEPSISRSVPQPSTQPPVTQPLPIILETPQHPNSSSALRGSSPGWQEIPPSLQQQWQSVPIWQPIPPTLQQQWNNEFDWQTIPADIVEEMQKGNPTYPARQQAIQDMAKSRFKNWMKRNGKKGDGKCPVCLCSLGDNGDETYILTTLCGHHFHEECVLEWFKTNDGCPVCRMKQE